MKRSVALAKLDDAMGEEMALILRNCVAQIISRDQKAMDEFANGFGALVKAYDAATIIITGKLTD
jgi:hypothetical protein